MAFWKMALCVELIIQFLFVEFNIWPWWKMNDSDVKVLLCTPFKRYLITSYYFFLNFSSLLHILPFETELGTSKGILGRCTQVFHVWDLRVITDSDLRDQEDLLQSLFTCWKKTEGRRRKRQGHQCHQAWLWGKKGKSHRESHKTQKSTRAYLSLSMWTVTDAI